MVNHVVAAGRWSKSLSMQMYNLNLERELNIYEALLMVSFCPDYLASFHLNLKKKIQLKMLLWASIVISFQNVLYLHLFHPTPFFKELVSVWSLRLCSFNMKAWACLGPAAVQTWCLLDLRDCIANVFQGTRQQSSGSTMSITANHCIV